MEPAPLPFLDRNPEFTSQGVTRDSQNLADQAARSIRGASHIHPRAREPGRRDATSGSEREGESEGAVIGGCFGLWRAGTLLFFKQFSVIHYIVTYVDQYRNLVNFCRFSLNYAIFEPCELPLKRDEIR
jgi:hypothetical protein